MSELNLEIQQLVGATRTASRPTDVDCDRVLDALQARLGLTLGVVDVTPKSAFRWLTPKVAAKSATGLTLVVTGSVLIYSMSRGVVPEALPAVGIPIASAAPSAASLEVATDQPAVVSTPEAPAASTGASPPSGTTTGSRRVNRSVDPLSEEVAILSRAEQELHGGRAESALRLLNEHERRFRNGTLAEERTVARIQALCALGRNTDANALLNRLSPNSLHGEATRQACTKK